MGCCIWTACGTSSRAVNQEYGHAELKFNREVWDADALWESYLKFFFLCIFFFKVCRRGNKGRESKLYFWGGGLEKNVNVVERKKGKKRVHNEDKKD